MNSYAVNVPEFQGPLEKLLELIEAKKLDVTTVSLAEVTNDFVAYVATLEKKETHMLADFVSVASRLVLIKSKSLLPTLQLTAAEEESMSDLQKRVEEYRKIRAAARTLRKAFTTGNASYSRGLFENTASIAHPQLKINVRDLFEIIKKLSAIETISQKESRSIKKALYTIEETIQKILERMREGNLKSFHEVATGKERGEVVVLFLALLHLARLGELMMNQETAFDDILITSHKKIS